MEKIFRSCARFQRSICLARSRLVHRQQQQSTLHSGRDRAELARWLAGSLHILGVHNKNRSCSEPALRMWARAAFRIDFDPPNKQFHLLSLPNIRHSSSAYQLHHNHLFHISGLGAGTVLSYRHNHQISYVSLVIGAYLAISSSGKVRIFSSLHEL